MVEQKLLRLKDVLKMTGMKKSSLYKLILDGNFPRPKKITTKSVAWLMQDIENWIKTLKS